MVTVVPLMAVTRDRCVCPACWLSDDPFHEMSPAPVLFLSLTQYPRFGSVFGGASDCHSVIVPPTRQPRGHQAQVEHRRPLGVDARLAVGADEIPDGRGRHAARAGATLSPEAAYANPSWTHTSAPPVRTVRSSRRSSRSSGWSTCPVRAASVVFHDDDAGEVEGAGIELDTSAGRAGRDRAADVCEADAPGFSVAQIVVRSGMPPVTPTLLQSIAREGAMTPVQGVEAVRRRNRDTKTRTTASRAA